MSGNLEELLASVLAVGENIRAVGRRASTSVREGVENVRFRMQRAFMEALWSVLGLSRFLLPILKFIALLWAIFFAAIGLYYLIYNHFVPKLLLEEPVYFNFDNSAPLAKINLLLPNDHSGEIISPSHYGKPLPKKFLRPGSIYDFSVKFSVAKSPRNQDIGKFMSYISVMDKADQLVAQSSRPVVVPYHSNIALLADQLLKLPYYFFGLPEAETLQIFMIRHYKEPYSESAATKSVEISISRSDVDIMDCTLTIYPEMSWFTYSLLHFPIVSFSVGVSLCFWGLFSTAIFYLTLLFLVRFIANVAEEEGGEEDAPPPHRRSPHGSDRGGTGSSEGRGGWMAEYAFDPLSSEDGGAAIEAHADDIHRAVRESLEMMSEEAAGRIVAAVGRDGHDSPDVVRGRSEADVSVSVSSPRSSDRERSEDEEKDAEIEASGVPIEASDEFSDVEADSSPAGGLRRRIVREIEASPSASST